MKPMSEKQKKAIEGCEYLLGIKYEGADTAQGAFFYLRDHIENARTELNRRIEAETEYEACNSPSRLSFYDQNSIMNQMEKYRYDDAEHESGDEDTKYPGTPTRESVDSDIRYWLTFL